MEQKYIHKKTGKPYLLLDDEAMLKQNGSWSEERHCIYMALYDNPDSQFFIRTQDDFFENFEPAYSN